MDQFTFRWSRIKCYLSITCPWPWDVFSPCVSLLSISSIMHQRLSQVRNSSLIFHQTSTYGGTVLPPQTSLTSHWKRKRAHTYWSWVVQRRKVKERFDFSGSTINVVIFELTSEVTSTWRRIQVSVNMTLHNDDYMNSRQWTNYTIPCYCLKLV